jgi:hypothetical protein
VHGRAEGHVERPGGEVQGSRGCRRSTMRSATSWAASGGVQMTATVAAGIGSLRGLHDVARDDS